MRKKGEESPRGQKRVDPLHIFSTPSPGVRPRDSPPIPTGSLGLSDRNLRVV